MATSHISNARPPVQSSPTHHSELSESRDTGPRVDQQKIVTTFLKYKRKPAPLPSSTLSEAGAMWLDAQAEKCRPRTVLNNETELRNLIRFFGDIPLSEFHIGHFEHYQATRSKEAGGSAINHELSTLSHLLKMADLWGSIRDHYNPLPVAEPKMPRIFTADEQIRIFKALNHNPNLALASIVFNITRNTTASGIELRLLRLRDVELGADPPRIHIPLEATKNRHRRRTIPLNEEAQMAFQRAVERSKMLGCHYPDSFLFPLCISARGNIWDPKRPSSGSWLQKQVVYLRKVTGIKHINPHVFRHLAVTELFESGAPEQTVIALAGWVNRAMIETYSHARIEAKADAVKLLAGRDPSAAKVSKQPSAKPDFEHPLVQAEIQRQVQLALQDHHSISAPTRQVATSQPHHAAGSTFLSCSTYGYALNLQKPMISSSKETL